MKRNDITDLRSKSKDELKRVLMDLRSEIEKLTSERTMNKLKNTNAIKSKKKDLARALTFLSMKVEEKVVAKKGEEASQASA